MAGPARSALLVVLLAASSHTLGLSLCLGRRPTMPGLRRAGTVVRGGAAKGDAGETFDSEKDHLAWLSSNAVLPQGFRVGTSDLSFVPVEAPHMGELGMELTLVSLDKPSTAWAGLFTSNAFPGAPVVVGRKRREAGKPIQAIVVNNKVSNVCARGDGQVASEEICAKLANLLDLEGGQEAVIPCSTGVIGWQLPLDDMLSALPGAVDSLQGMSALPAAQAIMTTDRFPKVRSATLPGGARIVAFGKGAGMIEPRLATMLVYILTDADVDQANLALALKEAVAGSFDCISVDSDESTSDTVLAVSSGKVPCDDLLGFRDELKAVCRALADDIVRNGEGTNHVIEVKVTGAPDQRSAIDLGRTVANSPLIKCAVAGNDPNVGRIVAAVGKYVGTLGPKNLQGTGTSFLQNYARDNIMISLGGRRIFAGGKFEMSEKLEAELVDHMLQAELGAGGRATFPAHKRTVQLEIYLGLGGEEATVLGSDLTPEYLTVNSDYRS